MRSRTTNVQAHSFPVPLFGGCPNPNSPYEDYDGVDRAAEQDAGTRRDCADTDGDGLPDGFELADWSPFDPLQADTSGNGTSDAEAFILAAESRQE